MFRVRQANYSDYIVISHVISKVQPPTKMSVLSYASVMGNHALFSIIGLTLICNKGERGDE